MRDFSITRIEAGFDWLQKEFDNTGEIQSIDLLIQKLDCINSTLAWSNEQMAIAKVHLNKAKVAAYLKLQASSMSQDKFYAPSLAKDYVAAQCHEAAYNYDLSERFSRSLVHIGENLRTSISALKQQLLMESYGQNVPR